MILRCTATLAIFTALVGVGPAARAQTADFDRVLAIQGGYGTVEMSGPTPTHLVTWPTGWSRVNGQVVATAQDTPEPFQARSTVPDKRTPQLIVGSAITLALLMILLVWLRYRPERDRP